MRKIIISMAAALSALSLAAQPKLTPDNIEDVIAAMTLQEKATLLVGSGWGSMMAGSMTASDASLVPGAAGTTRAITRLGIPQTVLSDGPAGLRIDPIRPGADQTFYCTGFPVGTSLASSWNTALVEDMLSAMGNEVLEYGADVLLAPGMDIHRNPLCGRNFEYFSEDPYLSGKIAAAYVKGIQSQGVGVSSKHYALNDQETNRMENDSRANVRAIREISLRGFEIMVKESNPWTIMSSYNKVNGTFAQQSRDLLTTILRDEWGFDGIVMTDWGCKEGTVAAVNAGNDLMEPGMDIEIERIIKGVENGEISEEQINTNVRNMLKFIVKTPRYKGYKYSNKPDLKAHAQIVREGAAEGMILLKNNGVLPLSGEVKDIALYGVGSYNFIAGGTGSGNVNKAYVRNVAEGLAENGYNVDKGIQSWYENYISFKKVDMANRSTTTSFGGLSLGDEVIPEMAIPRIYIDSKVASSDIAVLTISRNAGEGGDRMAVDGDFTLTGDEREMLQNLCDAYHVEGKKVIVVLNIGGVIETASWKSLPDAILLAWTPGQEGGYTVADILSGKSYPSGKLPMTFPVNYFDSPSSYNFPYNVESDGSMGFSSSSDSNPLLEMMGIVMPKVEEKNIDYTNYEEGIWVGYRYFNTAHKAVSYPFGYGLSYTSFSYSKPVVKVAKDGSVTAQITITNTGKAVGKEAVQLYVSAPEAGLVKPAQELRAFAKTRELKPGESETLTMTIDAYTLASFNEATSAWETAAGTYTAKFGASCEDIRATASFKQAKAQIWKVNDVLHPVTPIQEISIK